MILTLWSSAPTSASLLVLGSIHLWQRHWDAKMSCGDLNHEIWSRLNSSISAFTFTFRSADCYDFVSYRMLFSFFLLFFYWLCHNHKKILSSLCIARQSSSHFDQHQTYQQFYDKHYICHNQEKPNDLLYQEGIKFMTYVFPNRFKKMDYCRTWNIIIKLISLSVLGFKYRHLGRCCNKIWLHKARWI